MYGESPVGLTLRSYAPPNVEIDVNGLTLNLFADINFTVKDKNGEIKNLFDAQFVSLYLFEYFLLMSKNQYWRAEPATKIGVCNDICWCHILYHC